MKTIKKIGLSLVLTLSMTAVIFAQKTVITSNELPQKAQSFLKSYFSNQTVGYIVKDIETRSVDYDVHFANGMEIEFDAEGNWKEVDGEYQALPTGFIPSKIINYVTKQYPGTTISKIEKNPFKYEVKLSNGLELDFNTAGDFVRIDD
ncbi:PepSY-like domain-containing protein [Apibacter raozihei]|uniref:PepSY-like domain-containing protein n=1 Tax=Apibacter raozihei TaxID=2500547 RepID=UPI000FE44449|nr:PepSY-like domain-containing protein [Apibacter raozihei]